MLWSSENEPWHTANFAKVIQSNGEEEIAKETHLDLEDVRDNVVRYASESPSQRVIIWLDDKGNESSVLTRESLVKSAQGLAEAMRTQWKMKTGEKVLLVFLPGTDFIIAMMACLFGGFVAVPVYPPDPNSPKAGLLKLGKAVEVAQVSTVISHTKFLHLRRLVIGVKKFPRGLKWHNMSKVKPAASIGVTMPVASHELAFIQFSSGSTGDPKGVCVTHGNLNSNLASIKTSMGMSEDTVGVTWVPFYHDMGLVGAILTTLYSGAIMVAMSPISFLQNPFVWLNAISKYRGTTTCAPNFAYVLAVRKVPVAKRKELDLSCCKRYSNGAEPVRAETLWAFAEAYEKQGVKAEYLDPFYGMAENVVLISTHRGPHMPLMLRLKAGFSNKPGSKIVLVHPEEDGQDLVGNGPPGVGIEVSVVHPETRVLLEDDTIGELWVTGPSKVSEYLGKPALSEEELNAKISTRSDERTFLRTGDMGFVHKGEIFVCGRIKDMMIVRGRNIFPQDVESTVDQASTKIRPGCCAVFTLEGTENVVVVAEVRDGKLANEAGGLADLIRARIMTEHSFRPFAVILIKPRTIPKTTSGKIQRRAAREAYVQGELSVLVEARDESCLPERRSAMQRRASLAALDDLLDELEEMDLWTGPAQMRALVEEMNLAGYTVFDELACLRIPVSLSPLVKQLRELLVHRPILRNFAADLAIGCNEELRSSRVVGPLSLAYFLHICIDALQDRELFVQILPQVLDSLVENFSVPAKRTWFGHVQAGLAAWAAKLQLQQGGLRCTDENHAQFQLGLGVLASVGAEMLHGVKKPTLSALCGASLYEVISHETHRGHTRSAIVESFVAWNFAFLEKYKPFKDITRDLPYEVLLLVPSLVSAQSLDELYHNRMIGLLLLMGAKQSKLFANTERSIQFRAGTIDDAICQVMISLNAQCAERLANSIPHYCGPREMSAAPESLFSRSKYALRNLQRASVLPDNLFDNTWSELVENMESHGEVRAGENPDERLRWLLQCVRQSIEAPSLGLDDDLFEAGMSSMAMIEVNAHVENLIGFNETVEPDFIAKYRTVRRLAEAVEQKRMAHVELEEVKYSNQPALPYHVATTIQFLGIWVLFFMMSAAILPAYHYGLWVRYKSGLPSPWSHYRVTSTLSMFGLLVPFVIPLWIASFSLLVLVAKWIVVGKWRPCEVKINSFPYLRWWFVDRATHLWEIAVGRWFLNTPLLNIFYRAMGGQVSFTAKVKVNLRDLDLVHIGAGAEVRGTLVCRVFDAKERTLRFRRVKLGQGSRLRTGSVVMPGCWVGKGAEVVPLQVLNEGEKVAENIEAIETSHSSINATVRELFAKLFIMCSFLLLYFNTSVIIGLIWDAAGYPENFRYVELVYWASSYLVTACIMSFVAVGMKWILIGRLKTGAIKGSSLRIWAADYLFTLVWVTWIQFLDETRSILGYARGLGASIGPGSFVSAIKWIQPSNADMVKMGASSMASLILIETESEGIRGRVEIGDYCEVSYLALLGRGSTMQSRSYLGSLSVLMEGETLPTGYRQFRGATFPVATKEGEVDMEIWSTTDEILGLLMRVVLIVLVVFSLIPAYEFANFVLFDADMDRNAAILLLAVSFWLAMVSMMVAQKLMATAVLGFGKELQELPCRLSFYCSYQLFTYFFENLLLVVLHGTPFYNSFARFMGACVGRRVILLTGGLREHQLITLEYGAVVDNAQLTGHQACDGAFELGPSLVGAESVLQPGAVCLSNGIVHAGTVIHARSFAPKRTGAAIYGKPSPVCIAPEVA